MSIFSITLIVTVILFIREEILSAPYRKELKRAKEEYEAYEAYCRAVKKEELMEEGLLYAPSQRAELQTGCGTVRRTREGNQGISSNPAA